MCVLSFCLASLIPTGVCIFGEVKFGVQGISWIHTPYPSPTTSSNKALFPENSYQHVCPFSPKSEFSLSVLLFPLRKFAWVMVESRFLQCIQWDCSSSPHQPDDGLSTNNKMTRDGNEWLFNRGLRLGVKEGQSGLHKWWQDENKICSIYS